MADYVVLLSVPGLRRQDVERMPRLEELTADGDCGELVPGFPAVTCTVQANMTTGTPPSEHGVIANGSYDRDQQHVEMWTQPNSCIERPQLWDLMHQHDSSLKAAAWFPLHSVGAGADIICWPKPIHNPDGSESLWCYTRPEGLYQELFDELGHFPLHHFWGPMANITSSEWIVDSAIRAAGQFRPHLFYAYLSHLDYAAQKYGPDSEEAVRALGELDRVIGKMIDGFREAYAPEKLLWLVATEYVITPVEHVSYPNRILREAGLLEVRLEDGRELLDFAASKVWAMVDHQAAHVFVKDRDSAVIEQAREVLTNQDGVAEVLVGDEREKYDLVHPNSGDLVIVSEANSWQAYYWWLDDSLAPEFAQKVDIHRKPGYDPVEMFWDPAIRGVPLDATLVKGSHGAPATDASQRGVLLSSERGVFVERPLADTDVADIVLRQFNI